MNLKGHYIAAKSSSQLKLQICPGHFATSHSHVDHYINLSNLRINHANAKLAAKELAYPCQNTPIDTIVCVEYTQAIGAFMADALSTYSHRSVNEGRNIAVVRPRINSNNQLMFNDDVQEYVTGKNVLLLLSTISTGLSLNRAVECLTYYGANLTGIAAIFSAIEEANGMPVRRLFSPADMPTYHTYSASECPLCQAGRKLDGFVNESGYTRI